MRHMNAASFQLGSILNQTKGKFASRDWDTLEKARTKRELNASQKRKQP